MAMEELLSLKQWKFSDDFTKLVTWTGYLPIFTASAEEAIVLCPQPPASSASSAQQQPLQPPPQRIETTKPPPAESNERCLVFIKKLTEYALGSRRESGVSMRILAMFNPENPFLESTLQRCRDFGIKSDALTAVGNFYHILFVREYGKRHSRTDPNGTPTAIPAMLNAQPAKNESRCALNRHFLACGKSHGLIMSSSQIEVFQWGKLKSDDPIDGANIPLGIKIKSVVCGARHSACLTVAGDVYAWGDNQYGQLGLGFEGQRSSEDANEDLSRPNLVRFPHEAGPVRKIVSGCYHVLAVCESGVFGWGWSVHGQLGSATILKNVASPKRISDLPANCSIVDAAAGYAHSVFLTANGQVYGCGNNAYGQLGLPSIVKKCTRNCHVLLPLNEDETVCRLVSGYFHVLALTNKLRVLTWGASPQSLKFQALINRKKSQKQPASGSTANFDTSVESADGSSSSKKSANEMSVAAEGIAASDGLHFVPKEVQLKNLRGRQIAHLSAGHHHSMLLTSDGLIYAWGKNMNYQLGFGDKKERLIPTLLVLCTSLLRPFVTVSCGAEHTMAVDANGYVWAWGRNDTGQLGWEVTERNKLSGRTVTINVTGGRGPRTLTFPHDSRLLVSQPTRLTALRVSSTPTFDGLAPIIDKATLTSNLITYAGYYDAAKLEKLCLASRVSDVAAFLAFSRGKVARSLQIYREAPSFVSNDKEQTSALIHFYLRYIRADSDATDLCKQLIGLDPKTFQEAASVPDIWPAVFPVLKNFVSTADSVLSKLSTKFKVKIVRQCRQEAAKAPREQDFVEIPASVVQEALRNDVTAKVYACGHALANRPDHFKAISGGQCPKCLDGALVT